MGKLEEFMQKQGKTMKPNTLKDEAKKITKSKPFQNLSTSDKDKLLEIALKMLGII